jgi:hypothetical protein
MPRNSEKVPSVTMSAGSSSRAISNAFSPPPAHPASSAHNAAIGSGRCHVRYAPQADRRQAPHRADRQVDAAGDDDRCQRDRQQAELHAEPRHLEEVPEREDPGATGGEQHVSAAITASSAQPPLARAGDELRLASPKHPERHLFMPSGLHVRPALDRQAEMRCRPRRWRRE